MEYWSFCPWWGERGALQNRKTVARNLEKYARDVGIEPYGPHTLRHTFATQYLAANPSDLRGLVALLGHSSLDTVMVYTEPTMDDLAWRFGEQLPQLAGQVSILLQKRQQAACCVQTPD